MSAVEQAIGCEKEIGAFPDTTNGLRAWIQMNEVVGYQLSDELLQIAYQIAIDGWRARAKERGNSSPIDLSGSCKFSTLFVKSIFGGAVQGNKDHQYNVIDGIVVDLNAGSQDIKGMTDKGIDVYRHDELFFGNEDHLASMLSCVGRVKDWKSQFERLANAQNPEELVRALAKPDV